MMFYSSHIFIQYPGHQLKFHITVATRLYLERKCRHKESQQPGAMMSPMGGQTEEHKGSNGGKV